MFIVICNLAKYICLRFQPKKEMGIWPNQISVQNHKSVLCNSLLKENGVKGDGFISQISFQFHFMY